MPFHVNRRPPWNDPHPTALSRILESRALWIDPNQMAGSDLSSVTDVTNFGDLPYATIQGLISDSTHAPTLKRDAYSTWDALRFDGSNDCIWTNGNLGINYWSHDLDLEVEGRAGSVTVCVFIPKNSTMGVIWHPHNTFADPDLYFNNSHSLIWENSRVKLDIYYGAQHHILQSADLTSRINLPNVVVWWADGTWLGGGGNSRRGLLINREAAQSDLYTNWYRQFPVGVDESTGWDPWFIGARCWDDTFLQFDLLEFCVWDYFLDKTQTLAEINAGKLGYVGAIRELYCSKYGI